MAYTDPKLSSTGTTQNRRPIRQKALSMKEKALAGKEIKSTKVGAVFGAAGMLNPVTMAITGPIYLYKRGQGLSREDAANEAAEITWKVIGAVVTFAPVPGGRVIGPSMLALSGTVDSLGDKDIDQLKQLGKSIASSPEIRQETLKVGTQLAFLAATDQPITDERITKMAIDAAAKTATVAQDKAIAQGHITEADAQNIKQLATISKAVATTSPSRQTQLENAIKQG